MKLLNRDHGRLVRAGAAALGFVVSALATGRMRLAQELAGQFWTYGDFKVGARRAAWYCRRGWMNLDVFADEFFDPTEGMSDADLDVLKTFVSRRRERLPGVTYAGDMATIAARRLNNNVNPDARAANVLSFKSACDALLAQPAHPNQRLAPADVQRTGDFPIENAKRTLSDFQSLFPLETLRWFLISGTFLGLIREKGFLAHDYDIDLGVFEDEIDIASVMQTVEQSGTFVLKKYDHHQSTLFAPKTPANNPDVPYILKLVHVTGIHIDLFIHYHDTAGVSAVHWHGSSLHRWENSAFDLATYDFYDQKVLGPADPDRYLTENYGDWRTPVTEFNCTTDTPNLALVPHPIAIVIFLKRYVLARGIDPKQAQKLEMELLQSGFLQHRDDGGLTFSGDFFAG